MKKKSNDCFGLDRWAGIYPEKKAVITEHASISYAGLWRESSLAARALGENGIMPGDTVLIFLPNSIEYAVTFFAAVKLRLNILLANVLYKSSELGALIRTAQPKAAFVKGDREGALIQSTAPALSVICVPDFLKKLDGVTDAGTSDTTATSGADSARICISTSGSTGTPKIVANSYENEGINASLYVDRMQVTDRDVLLTSLPAAQRFGLAALLGSCMKGATLVMTDRFRAGNMLSLIDRYHVTVQYGVPTMFLKEMNEYDSMDNPRPNLSSLRTGVTAGAGCPEDIFRWFESTSGCRLLNCYGTSEIGGLTMAQYDDSEEIRHHTCGTAFPGASVKILDSGGVPLPPGSPGEIVCRVPWIMEGYLGDERMTAQMFDKDGEFLTGDIGMLDEEGHLIFNVRKKDLIIRGGYNISPFELEQALTGLPDVLEACVMGYEDSLLGERIVAFVRPADAGVDKDSLIDELSRHIARYKLPDCILYMDRLPKLPNGKYDYPALKVLLSKENLGSKKTD